MRFVTPRLEIRLAQLGEGFKLADYYRENREFLQPFYPRFSREDFDASAWEATLPQVHADFDARRSIRLCLLQNGRVCGVVNTTSVIQSPRFSATIGYSLAKNLQAQGLMKEALERIVPAAINRLRLHRLEANYMPRNERSARLLARLGFQKEGLAHRYLMIDGVWEDHVLAAKINHDWS